MWGVVGVGVKVGNQPQMVRDGGCSVATTSEPKGTCLWNMQSTGVKTYRQKAVRGLKTRGTFNNRTENIERPTIRITGSVDVARRRSL